MANVRLAHIVLKDKWPGEAAELGIPTDGWDNTVHNFNTLDDTAKALDPPVPLGQKIKHYTDNTNCPGWYTMIYLCYHDVSAVDVSADFSDGNFWCSHVDTSKSQWSDVSQAPYFVVSRCYTGTNRLTATDATRNAPLAVPCASVTADSSLHASITDNYTTGYGDAYGWFWGGGVCPVKDVTIMGDLTYGSTCGGRGVDITAGQDLERGSVFAEFSGATLMLTAGEFSSLAESTEANAMYFCEPIGWACCSAE
jgi:hypothetical protein